MDEHGLPLMRLHLKKEWKSDTYEECIGCRRDGRSQKIRYFILPNIRIAHKQEFQRIFVLLSIQFIRSNTHRIRTGKRTHQVELMNNICLLLSVEAELTAGC